MYTRNGMRGNSLRGMGAFGMGSTVSLSADAIGAELARLLGVPATTPTGAPALTLDALLMPIAQTDEAKQLVDSTFNSLLDNPQLAAYLQERALNVVWDRYKVQVILGTIAILGLAFYLGHQQGQGAKHAKG